jgi:sortase (surface protein transpeptidase)
VRAAVDYVGYSRLVLSACTPLFSAAKRLLVYAHLTRTVPVGAARRVPGGGAVRPIIASRAA